MRMESRSILFFCHFHRASGLTYPGVSRLSFAGWFAFARTDEDGVAKEAVLRPRQIDNLGDKLPPHPMDASQLASEASLSHRSPGQRAFAEFSAA